MFFEKAFQLNPISKEIGIKLAETYGDICRFADQKNIYKKLYEIYPEDPEIKARHTIHTQQSEKQEFIENKKSRIDYFIIWGNGLKYKDDVLKIIRDYGDFEILRISNHKIENIQEFVFRLYEPDPVPWEHLVSKTQYLMTSYPELIIIIVKNIEPKEKFYGSGEFRHIQCEKIKFIKEFVRNIYNPRVNGIRSEEHVIHGSDFEEQVVHLLKILNLGSIEKYKHPVNRFLKVPFHLPEFNTFIIKKINMDDIYCSISIGEPEERSHKIVSVSETPHYKYLAGIKNEYYEYQNKYSGSLFLDDHSEDAFDALINKFNYDDKMNDGNFVLLKKIENNKYQVLDGVHRASILQFKQTKEIIAAVVE